MADKDENAPKGADWEVVSLTASAYAAAPGGNMNNIPQIKHEENVEVVEKDKVETSNTLFMSGHFVLPPKDNTEIRDQDSESVKENDNFDLTKLTEFENYNKIPFSDEKLSPSDTTLSGLNLAGKLATSCTANPLVEKEQSIYTSATLDSLQSEATLSAYNKDDVLNESIHSCEEPKEDKNDGCGVNYGVWLKKHVVSLYAHTKETSTFWSIFAAAAVMGIVIIGQQWQHERWQVLRHELKFRIHDERMKMMTGLKDTLIGGNRRDFLVNGSTTRDR